jgi:hypothetical protein
MEGLSHTFKSAQKKVTVYARGDSNDWLFLIHENRRVITSGFGSLPRGYNFNNETATYALAQAHRFITQTLLRVRVVMVCTRRRR